MSGIAGFFLGILFVLLLLLLFGVFVFFNLFGMKTITVDFISQGVSPYTEIEAKIVQDQVDNRAKEEALNAREEELNARADEIALQEENAANLMAQARQVLDDAQFYRDQLDDTTVAVSRIADWMGRMDPQRAGSIMAEMGHIEYMMRILKAMDDKKASAIMESVDPKLASYWGIYMQGETINADNTDETN